MTETPKPILIADNRHTSFLTFCVELYAEHKSLPSPDIYRLFKKTDLLDMLITDYEDLHGMSFEYLMRFFDEYLEVPGFSTEKK